MFLIQKCDEAQVTMSTHKYLAYKHFEGLLHMAPFWGIGEHYKVCSLLGKDIGISMFHSKGVIHGGNVRHFRRWIIPELEGYLVRVPFE